MQTRREFCWAAAGGVAWAQGPAKPIAFVHVTVIDPAVGTSEPDMTVVVNGGRIAEVARALKPPAGAQIVDGGGKHLIPGLWDMHAHQVPDSIPLFVANGITGVRSMADDLERVKTARDRIAAGEVIGPRIYFCGPHVDGPQRPRPAMVPVSTPEEGHKVVADLRKRGVDFIKVYDGLSREAYFAIADEARQQHIPFVGHVPLSFTAAEVSDAGQKSIEHMPRILAGCSREEAGAGGSRRPLGAYDDEKAKALFAKFVKNGTWVTPTLTVQGVSAYWKDPEATRDARIEYVPERIRQSWANSPFTRLLDSMPASAAPARHRAFDLALDVAGRMHRAGVRILAGTDTGIPYVVQGFSLHRELQWLVKAGLTPLEALRSAISRPAEYLGIADSTGSIAKGKSAGLVLLNADPLQDIANTQKIESVMAGGRYLSRNDLDGMLEKLKR